MAVMVSVDWDAFSRRRDETNDKTILVTDPTTGKLTKASVFQFWDWAHSETQSALLNAICWQSRYATFRRWGVDPYAECGIWPTPSLALFAQTITKRFDRPEDAPLLISDSHAFGIEVAQTAQAIFGRRKPLERIVHFDAHHDCGYGVGVRDWHEKRIVDCGTWLFAALDAGMAKGADVIYPDWRTAQEKRGHEFWKSVSRRVKFYTWSEWVDKGKCYGRVAATHLCRSSAWTPPWLDDDFAAFSLQLPHLRRSCLDCAPGGQRIGAFDACKPRAWDHEQAERYREASTQAFSGHDLAARNEHAKLGGEGAT